MTRVVALVALALFACTRPEPSSIVPEPAPSPTSKPAPIVVESEPTPLAEVVDEGPELPFAESHELRGSDEAAVYQFAGETFTTDLELEITIGDEGTGIELRHPGREGVLDDGPELCLHEFYQGDSFGARIVDHGRVADGRRLLEVWAACHFGEDIVSIESVVWLVLDDGAALTQVWKGEARFHGSWVCATFDNLVFAREGDEVVLTRSEVGEIYEPGVVEYDCEDARQYVEARGTERIALP